MAKRKAVSQDFDKRAYHNALEKQRRDDINVYFNEMKNCVPEFENGGAQLTKKNVLNGVANYITRMEKSNAALRDEIRYYERDNKLKFEQIKKLEKAKAGNNRRKYQELLESINCDEDDYDDDDDDEEVDEYSNQNLVTVANFDTDSESGSSNSSFETDNFEANSDDDDDDDEVPRSYNQILFDLCQNV